MPVPSAQAGYSAISTKAMAPGRCRFVLILLGVILLGHAAAVGGGDNLWPFSQYKLYASPVQMGVYQEVMLHGITPAGDRVRLTHHFFEPLDRGRYRRALGRTVPPDPSPRAAEAALAPWLGLYRDGRLRGTHAGPPLVGLRLYVEERLFHHDARNRHDPPEKKFLQAEYLEPRGTGDRS
jgi:hypothetical protein